MDGFVRKNWFDVKAEELDDGTLLAVWVRQGEIGSRMIIGLNPPFGVNAALANQFVRQAAGFKPRFMMLICPANTQTPEDYKIVFEDKTLCKDK